MKLCVASYVHAIFTCSGHDAICWKRKGLKLSFDMAEYDSKNYYIQYISELLSVKRGGRGEQHRDTDLDEWF